MSDRRGQVRVRKGAIIGVTRWACQMIQGVGMGQRRGYHRGEWRRANPEINLGDPGQERIRAYYLNFFVFPTLSAISRLPYRGYLGGVFALRPVHYLKINGFPNTYWDWDREDNDIAARWGGLDLGSLAQGCRFPRGVGTTGCPRLRGAWATLAREAALWPGEAIR